MKLYADGIGGATLANGVLRLELMYRDARGEDVTAGELILPATRVGPFFNGLKELIGRMQDQGEAAGNA